MYILTLETTGKFASVAVADENGMTVMSSSHAEMDHLRHITVLTEECLSEMGICKGDITHVAASIGPGSFTGIRIGVTFARTFAQILGLPCISVPTLEGMMMLDEVRRQDARDPSAEGYAVCTIINARRGQTYGAIWKKESAAASSDTVKADAKSGSLAGYVEVLPQGQHMIDDIIKTCNDIGGKIFFYGDGIDAYGEIISEKLTAGTAEFAGSALRYQSADAAAKVAFIKAKDGDTVGFSDLLPNYMRKSEAETKLENGTLSGKIGVRK